MRKFEASVTVTDLQQSGPNARGRDPALRCGPRRSLGTAPAVRLAGRGIGVLFACARTGARRVAAALCLSGTLITPALGDYPERAVTLIVPFTPGGATDLVARILSEQMGQRLGQAVIVVNKPGAGTAIGAAALARSPSDGYTLLFGTTSSFTINPAVRANLSYDALQFEAIGIVGSTPLVLFANPALPVTTVAELVALARQSPRALTYASFGTGTSAHFAGEIFQRATVTEFLHVPYKGSAPALQALAAGDVQLAVDTVVAGRPLVAAGKIKPLAVMASRRPGALPNVPTVAESGYPGFAVEPWAAVVAPRGLSQPVRRTLVKALAEAVADPGVRQALSNAGVDVRYEPPEAYDQRVADESPLMRSIVRETGIRLD